MKNMWNPTYNWIKTKQVTDKSEKFILSERCQWAVFIVESYVFHSESTKQSWSYSWYKVTVFWYAFIIHKAKKMVDNFTHIQENLRAFCFFLSIHGIYEKRMSRWSFRADFRLILNLNLKFSTLVYKSYNIAFTKHSSIAGYLSF